MSKDFFMPQQIITGANAVEESAQAIKKLGNKALIVCGKVMTAQGVVGMLENVLKKNEIDYTIFSEIIGEPTDVMVVEGVKKYKEENCDFFIALGGGSPMDAMKAMAALITNQGELASFQGKEFENSVPPMVAIPTTSGTGSEATRYTIITNPKTKVKMFLKGNVLLPTLAVIDPNLTITAPKKITAATGMDALVHAVETYTSKKSQPLSDVFSLSATKRIFKNLPEAYKNGDNLKAREEMCYASLEAGIAINNSSVTIVHGMSRPIGANFHVPHGLSNAMLFEKCMRFVVDGAYGKFATLGRTIEVATCKDSDEVAAKKFVEEIGVLCEKLEIQTLEEYGINKDEFFGIIDKMSFDAMGSGSPQNTIKEIDIEDVKMLYRNLW